MPKKRVVSSKKALYVARPATAQNWVALFGEINVFPPDLQSELKFSKIVEAGLPTGAVDAAVATGLLELSDIDQLIVSRRTFERRKEKDERLSPDESDRLARVMRVMARAEQALGDTQKATDWLRQPNRALGGKEPFDLLTNDMGARAIEKVLGRIEHGIYS